MRVRALDVHSASIDGTPLAMGACTLAARTETDGRQGWEASGWVARHDTHVAARARPSPVSVVLETDGGTLTGSAYVSVGHSPGRPQGGPPVLFVGVGRLEPWPG